MRLIYEPSDPSHLRFIMLASILRAVTFGITISDWVMNSNKLARAVGKVITD